MTSRSLLRRSGLVLYCVAIWLVCDLVYSQFFHMRDVRVRTAHERYHHGLLPNVAGNITWGPLRYRIDTNSLGFRDATVRDVPLKSATHRILLIGDSFTEGIGMEFADSFAGMLVQAANGDPHTIEVLNAGVASYSPVIYFQKIKHLIEIGLQFDEVVVLPDISDIRDEATAYFCIDDDPRYRAHCDPADRVLGSQRLPRGLQLYFVMTDRLRSLAEHAMRLRLAGRKQQVLHRQAISGWTLPEFDVRDDFAPLGVEDGIARAAQNMQLLADLLAARGIPLTLAVYPWPMQLEHDDRDSRHVRLWRDFCARNACKDFIDAFPAFFAVKDSDPRWYERLYIGGDFHFSPEGNRVLFRVLADRLMPER